MIKVLNKRDIVRHTAQDLRLDGGPGVRPIEAFVVHKDGGFYAYLNRCPHTGVALNWKADEFFNVAGTLLQCTTHGALFEPDTGLCVDGPCMGQHLTKIPISIHKQRIHIKLASLDL